MAFQVSPGVLVQERDLTRIIPAVSTSIGAFAGDFRKGPLDEVTSVSSEQELVSIFGKPDTNNFEDWFSAASFLQYSNTLRIVRAQNTSISNATASGSTFVIKNVTHYQDNYEQLAVTTVNDASTAVGDKTVTVTSGTSINVGDIVNFAETGGYEYRVTAKNTNDISFVRKDTSEGGLHSVITNGANVRRRWRYYDLVSKAPGTSPYVLARSGSGDELHVVVIDRDGEVTGTPGEILETYDSMSKASDAKNPQGDTNYYPTVILNKSSFIYWMDHNTSGSNWGNATSGTTYTDVTTNTYTNLSNGSNGSNVNVGEKKTAYEKFEDADTVDVGLIIAGPGNATHVDNLITIAEKRKDAVVFASPERSDVVNVADSVAQTSNVIGFFNGISSSSYITFDSGYKYMYDRYNDVNRFIPLNGDMAGLSARTDLIADAWFSPAGLNRGQVRGAIKLAYNPTKTQRDELYRARVNPVVTFPGQGTLLFGDKTGLSAPSAFDRINVRRLFITLEKAIATASKFQLFEFNDEFSRANFRNIVEPFLREVQGRRGITDFLVVCDETNNTGEVIDRNEFIAEIFVKPARSINFITLSFIATRTGVAFEEVAG